MLGGLHPVLVLVVAGGGGRGRGEGGRAGLHGARLNGRVLAGSGRGGGDVALVLEAEGGRLVEGQLLLVEEVLRYLQWKKEKLLRMVS